VNLLEVVPVRGAEWEEQSGSHAWRQFDGMQSVAEIAGALRAEFGGDVEPAEERVCKLVQMLHGQLLVEYPGIDG
jgi:hypothetical protein